jgi:hypothetical protein
MSLSAKAGAYRSTPMFASHSAIGCTTDLTPSTEIEHFNHSRPALDTDGLPIGQLPPGATLTA